MNLKTFAVHQKLNTNNDELLKYVMNGESVPVSVLEQSFGSLLAPLQDDFAETLTTDHIKALTQTVPLIVTVLPSGGYNISGEIPDTVMETVTLLHNVEENEVISALVDNQLNTIYGKSCDITDLSVDQITEDKTPTSMMDTVAATEPLVDEFSTDDVMFDEPVEEPPFSDFVDDVKEELATDFVSDIMEESTEEKTSVLAENTVEETSVSDEELIPNEDPTIDEEAQQVTEAIRRIYEKFCNDLVQYKLDERLNLNF